MILHRFLRARYLFTSQEVSKGSASFNSLKKEAQHIKKLIVSTGLLKPSGIKEQHVLIFVNLVGVLPFLKAQCHGKRKKRTVALSTLLLGRFIWASLDKFINEVFAKVVDFGTIRLGRVSKKKERGFCNYTYKLNRYYNPLVDFAELITNEMYAEHRGLFLSLEYHFTVCAKNTKAVEDHFHKLQLPFIFFKRKHRPAFDDKKVIDIRKSHQIDNSIKKSHRRVYN